MAERYLFSTFGCIATRLETSPLRAYRPLRRLAQCRRQYTQRHYPSWRRLERVEARRHLDAHRTSSLSQSRSEILARPFSSTTSRPHGDLTPPKPGEERHITFLDKEGASHTFEVADGDNLLDIAQAHDLEMEGACGGSCACSTCHVIVQDDDFYDKIEEPSDDENDMLDLAFGLTETSRLGCQVQMSKELDGLVVKLPSMTRNMQASDFAEKK